jgi:hypothetical protein
MTDEATRGLNCGDSSAGDGFRQEMDAHSAGSLVGGEDYYSEGDAIVFTERYHLRRGYCCESGCRHCPFGEDAANAPKPPKKRAK